MRTKYFNDGIVGNKKIKASFTKTGELIRLFYGSADYKQFLDLFHTGIKVNDSAIIYLHTDINNIYSQKYKGNTNILETDIFNNYFKIRTTQTDFVPIDEDILIKKYVFKNENTIDLKVNFLAYSKILRNMNNDTCGFVKNDALIQYNHDFSVCTFSDKKLLSRQINGASNNFMQAVIGGKDYIGMSADSAISYDIGTLKPGEEAYFTLFVYINKNKHTSVIQNIDEKIESLKKLNVQELEKNTSIYWEEYVKSHDNLNINSRDLKGEVKNVYNRTILLFPLLINEKTGGISAGIEVDEDKTKCGRYSYCWPRDAVFITEALDLVNMNEEADKFYSQFCQMTQSKNGMWEQRFFTDGRLAPSWGYQIDETASVIYGVYSHFKKTDDKIFLEKNFEMCQKATGFLKAYLDDLFKNKGEFSLSYDLWEEYEGTTLYSLSAVYSAFLTMIKLYNEKKRLSEISQDELQWIEEETLNLTNLSNDLKKYCQIRFYDENRKSYVRNEKDRKIDISLLGAIVPFEMLDISDSNVYSTIEKINMTIRTHTGGYIRYEDDGYMGGYNPWPIATLWMAWYYIKANDISRAWELFDFVTNSASSHGFLGEQVNNDAMKPSWVIGLTWSHAMYLIILSKLLGAIGGNWGRFLMDKFVQLGTDFKFI